MPMFKLERRRRGMKTFAPTVSFIVPLSNKEQTMANCAEKLFNYASRHDEFVEIFLVDNGSQRPNL